MLAAALAVLALALAGCTSPSGPQSPDGATTGRQAHTVEGRSDGGAHRFAPADLTVAPGENVTFRILSGTHTVTFQDAQGVSRPASGPLQAGQDFTVSFSKAGTYPYRCDYHPGMTGNVTVRP